MIPAVRRLSQEDHESKVSKGHIGRPYLQKQKKKLNKKLNVHQIYLIKINLETFMVIKMNLIHL
jgi:hypothetical protein